MMSNELAGGRLGKYEIRAEIGRGGMGTVYLGYDPLLDRRVAIKVLAPHLVWEQNFVERFLREARAAARLKHPNIVTIYDVGQEGSWYYFVMEYIEGQTLAEVIKRRGAMAPAEVMAVLRPLADALDYAHRQGLVHRDIKPGNVVVGPAGQVTLTDFGIARAAQEVRLTTTGALVGTPEYMSPEQAMGEEVDQRTDQYSLGVVAYEMLTGRVPFGGTTPHGVLYKQVHEPPPPISRVRPELPAGVEAALQQALAKEPGQRYATVTAFVEALSQALAGKGAAAVNAPTLAAEPARGAAARPVTPPPHRPPASEAAKPAPTTAVRAAPAARAGTGRRRASGWVWLLAGLALLVLIALGAAILLLTGGEKQGQVATVAAPTKQTYPTQPLPPPPTAGPAPAQPFQCADKIGCVDVSPGQPILLGYVLVTTGDSAPLGIDSRRGVELAMADRPEVRGHPLELIGMDTQCSQESGVAAAEKLTGDPRLVAVVGPSCSSEARAAIPILCRAGVSLVSPSSTAPDLTAEDRPADFWCFLRTAHNDTVQGMAAAHFAREALKLDRAATIHDSSLYADRLQQLFAEEFKKLGGTITTQEAVDPQITDAKPVLARIADTKPQILYYPIFFGAGVPITLQAREVPGLENVKRMASDGIFYPDFLKAVGDAAVGFYWSSPDLTGLGPAYDEFVKKYRDRYGEAPISAFHAHAYDATTMILNAIEQVAVQDADGTLHIPRGALNEALHATKGFPGLTGALSCNPLGDCANPKFAVYECVNANPDSWNPGPGPDNNPRKIWP
jgi:branched-chain amino acid transport system substrate-binding protein